jgi:hypothetical protein
VLLVSMDDRGHGWQVSAYSTMEWQRASNFSRSYNVKMSVEKDTGSTKINMNEVDGREAVSCQNQVALSLRGKVSDPSMDTQTSRGHSSESAAKEADVTPSGL